jgi:hypothetical protein
VEFFSWQHKQILSPVMTKSASNRVFFLKFSMILLSLLASPMITEHQIDNPCQLSHLHASRGRVFIYLISDYFNDRCDLFLSLSS